MAQNTVRPIDANALVRKIKAHIGNTELGKLLIGLINMEPTIDTGFKWTRAAEDLPKMSGYYFCMHSGNRKLCWFWHETGVFEINGKKTSKVTHWMPMPAEPEEECS